MSMMEIPICADLEIPSTEIQHEHFAKYKKHEKLTQAMIYQKNWNQNTLDNVVGGCEHIPLLVPLLLRVLQNLLKLHLWSLPGPFELPAHIHQRFAEHHQHVER